MMQFLYLASARPRFPCFGIFPPVPRLVLALVDVSSPAPPALDMSGPKVSIETIDVSDDGKLKVDVFFVRNHHWSLKSGKKGFWLD